MVNKRAKLFFFDKIYIEPCDRWAADRYKEKEGRFLYDKFKPPYCIIFDLSRKLVGLFRKKRKSFGKIQYREEASKKISVHKKNILLLMNV